jgi:hypothetical protein
MEISCIIDMGENLKGVNKLFSLIHIFMIRPNTAVVRTRGNGENMDQPEKF